MNSITRWFPILGLLLVCGCFQVQDEVTVQPDGSGKVTLTLRTSLSEEATGMMMGMSGMGGRGGMYPPFSESQAKQFFPPKDFSLKVEEKQEGDAKTMVIEAAFKNVNALLASPYGRAHQLSIRTNGAGKLLLQALSGGSTMAQAAQFKPEGPMASMQMPGLEDAQKKKGEMRFTFRVTLPNAATSATGTCDKKSVTWDIERGKTKDDEEFAARLGRVLEATCGAEGITFSPAPPPRLGLLPFSELTAGKVNDSAPLPDTNKIATAARFVPYFLHTIRALDLSGEGAGQQSQTELTGGILIPGDLAPQRWGDIKLEEAVDAKGNNLMPKENPDSDMPVLPRYNHYGDTSMGDEEEQDDQAPAKEVKPKPHVVSLRLKAPDWKVKKIARIKGRIDLQYLGRSEIIKLSNAVPASLVMNMGEHSSFNVSSDSERGQVSDSRLVELGLMVRVQMAMVQSGITTLSLETGGSKAALVDAQVFDADGRPWPTTLMQSDSAGGEERSCQLMVAGKPKPPFSLALAVGGVGASVAVPILVENVSVGEK